MEPISLSEVIELTQSVDTLDDPRIYEFVELADHTATDILKNKNSEYLSGLVSLIQSATATVLATTGEADDIESALMTVVDSRIRLILAIAIKLTIGISVIDEIR